jgi:putative FmdB family regulatory protein
MPIYEYRCEECDHQLEALQRISDEPLNDCPECESPTLKKQISAAGFRLKGSGWYETDFKTGNKRNLAGETKSDSGKADKKSGKTDSKDKKTVAKKDNNQSASAA